MTSPNVTPYREARNGVTTFDVTSPAGGAPGVMIGDVGTPSERTPDVTNQLATTPRAATPGVATPCAATPDGLTLCAATPDGTTPCAATPGGTTPRAATPDGTNSNGATRDASILDCDATTRDAPSQPTANRHQNRDATTPHERSRDHMIHGATTRERTTTWRWLSPHLTGAHPPRSSPRVEIGQPGAIVHGENNETASNSP